jgi:hypothetical protein
MIIGTTRQALEEVLAETNKELAEVIRRIQGLQKRAEDLKAEKMGLQMALARRVARSQERKERVLDTAVAVMDAAVTAHDAFTWRSLTRTDAILRLLRETDQSISPTDISKMLRSRGREDDTPDYVSAALAYLKRNGKVERSGYGKWILTSPQSTPLSLNGAGSATFTPRKGGGDEIAAHAD